MYSTNFDVCNYIPRSWFVKILRCLFREVNPQKPFSCAWCKLKNVIRLTSNDEDFTPKLMGTDFFKLWPSNFATSVARRWSTRSGLQAALMLAMLCNISHEQQRFFTNSCALKRTVQRINSESPRKASTYMTDYYAGFIVRIWVIFQSRDRFIVRVWVWVI